MTLVSKQVQRTGESVEMAEERNDRYNDCAKENIVADDNTIVETEKKTNDFVETSDKVDNACKVNVSERDLQFQNKLCEPLCFLPGSDIKFVTEKIDDPIGTKTCEHYQSNVMSVKSDNKDEKSTDLALSTFANTDITESTSMLGNKVSGRDSTEPLLNNDVVCPKNKFTLPEACKSGRKELVLEVLQEFTGDINSFIDGWTCLHDVCMRECQFSEVTEVLLQNGADVNIQDKSGNTPLHIAISYHCISNIKVLLKYNADIYRLNKEGASPVQTAIFLKDNEILELFGHEPVPEKMSKVTLKNNKRKANVLESFENTSTQCHSPPILKKRKLDRDDDKEIPNKRRHSVTFQNGHAIKFFDKNAKVK